MKNRAFTLIELLVVVSIIAVMAGIAVPNFLEAQTRTKISRTKQDMASLSASLRAYQSDYHVYPAHLPERQRFLEKCLELDVIDSTTLSTPGDVSLPWLNTDAPSRNMGMWGMGMGMNGGMFGFPESLTDDATTETLTSETDEAEVTRTVALKYWENMGRYPVMDHSGMDLYPLTTPVAYFSHQLPVDPFCDISYNPYYYVNMYSLLDNERGDLLPGDNYLLLSWGPNFDQTDPDFKNPVKGPFTPYDPSNGTVSAGDIYLIDE